MQPILQATVFIAAALAAPAAAYLYWRLRWGPPAAGAIPILAYHKVDDRFELGGTWTTPAQFARQMEWLKSNGFKTVTMSRAGELAAEGGPGGERLVCLTFDDGYQSLYRHVLPVLRENGFTATVFVVTDYVGRENEWDVNWGGRRFLHLGWGEMREMQAAGIEFGSHGASHRDLRHLDDAELQSEINGSKLSLENGLGRTVEAFCYPFGRYDARVREAVARAGYRCACSHSPRMPNRQIDIFALRRCGVYITDIMWDFRNKIDHGSRWFWTQDLWSRTVNFCAGGTAAFQRLKARPRKKPKAGGKK